MPRFAANLTMMFTEVPFPERFQAAAEAGFAAVEFLFPYEWPAADVAKWRAAAGVEQVLINMPPGDWEAGERGLAALPGREDEFKGQMAQALEYAEALACPRVHCMAGVPGEGADQDACYATFQDNLAYACGAAAKLGVDILIEPLNFHDAPGYFVVRQDFAHKIVAEVGAVNLAVPMDFYHCQIVEGNLAMALQKYIAGVGHFQISSVPDRHEPDEGEINYPYLFGLIDELGYQGWIGCEYRPRAGTVEGLGWLKPYGIG